MNHDKNIIEISDLVNTCIQCGTCSATCPNAFAMDITPRKMWKMVLSGRTEELFGTKTFMLCSSCYHCTLRCPRGLPLTRAMGLLKQDAAKRNIPMYRRSTEFYKSFMTSVKNHGRVRETEMMTLYFLSLKNPFTPLKFTPVGAKLFMKGKLSLEIPSRGKRRLERIFSKVLEMEDSV